MSSYHCVVCYYMTANSWCMLEAAITAWPAPGAGAWRAPGRAPGTTRRRTWRGHPSGTSTPARTSYLNIRTIINHQAIKEGQSMRWRRTKSETKYLTKTNIWLTFNITDAQTDIMQTFIIGCFRWIKFQVSNVSQILKNTGNPASDGHRNLAFLILAILELRKSSLKLDGQRSNRFRMTRYTFETGHWKSLNLISLTPSHLWKILCTAAFLPSPPCENASTLR